MQAAGHQRMPAGRIVLALLGMLIGLNASAGSARADERFFMLVFGSQSQPKLLRHTHTWATFVRATSDGPDPAGAALQTVTISWLPRTLEVHVWDPRPEPGVNLGMDDTLRYVMAHGETVNAWGPFEVKPEVWNRAVQVAGILESGQAQYRAISGSRDLLVSDCIHAVAAVDAQFGRNHYPLVRVGKPASRHMARQIMMRSVFDQAQADHRWLIPRLGLDRDPVLVIPPSAIPARPCGLCKLPD